MYCECLHDSRFSELVLGVYSFIHTYPIVLWRKWAYPQVSFVSSAQSHAKLLVIVLIDHLLMLVLLATWWEKNENFKSLYI